MQGTSPNSNESRRKLNEISSQFSKLSRMEAGPNSFMAIKETAEVRKKQATFAYPFLNLSNRYHLSLDEKSAKQFKGNHSIEK